MNERSLAVPDAVLGWAGLRAELVSRREEVVVSHLDIRAVPALCLSLTTSLL